jgi:O-antigen/teichoic acid export membrane protein
MKIFKNKKINETFWALIAKGIAVLGGLFFVIFIPKNGSVNIYGALSLILAYITIFSMLSGTQINSAVKNEIVKHKLTNSISKDFFFEGIKLKFYLFIPFSFVFVIVIYLLRNNLLLDNMVLILVLLISMNTLGLVIAAFEALHELFFEALLYIVEYSLTVGLIIFFGLGHNLNITNILYSFIIGYICALFLGFVLLCKKFAIFQDIKIIRFNPNTFKILLKRTFYLTLAGISMIILSKIDSVMLGFLSGIESVGYYNIAGDIVKNSVMLSIPFMLGALPLFFEKDEKTFIITNVVILLIINSIIAIGILLFGRSLINTIYGSGFGPSLYTMYALALYPLFASLQMLAQEILILKDKTKLIFIFGVVTVVINIILNLLLIPRLGTVGTAYAITISYCIWFMCSFIYLIKNFKKITPDQKNISFCK